MSTPQPIFSNKRMSYETPSEGITIGGYIARRLHKTVLLQPVAKLLPENSAEALARIALYAAAASASFGPALYQPEGDRPGAVIETTDPETGARASVTCKGKLRFAYSVALDGVGTVTGEEKITGTTVGWRGLGMPAPSLFDFASDDGAYRAKLTGIITSELAPGLGRWRIRGYGTLDLADSAGNRGRLTLDRSGLASVFVTSHDGKQVQLRERLA
ncbi:MAG TPA: hypothetical protein VIX58_07800 [Anaerolineae bacterium]